MTGGGRYRQPFFSFSVNNSLSINEMIKKYSTVTPVILRFYMCPQVFTMIRSILKEKMGSKVTTLSHEKTLS